MVSLNVNADIPTGMYNSVIIVVIANYTCMLYSKTATTTTTTTRDRQTAAL